MARKKVQTSSGSTDESTAESVTIEHDTTVAPKPAPIGIPCDTTTEAIIVAWSFLVRREVDPARRQSPGPVVRNPLEGSEHERHIEARGSRIPEVTAAIHRAHDLVSAALLASKELDAPRPVVLGVRTALRLAIAELDGVRERLAR